VKERLPYRLSLASPDSGKPLSVPSDRHTAETRTRTLPTISTLDHGTIAHRRMLPTPGCKRPPPASAPAENLRSSFGEASMLAGMTPKHACTPEWTKNSNTVVLSNNAASSPLQPPVQKTAVEEGLCHSSIEEADSTKMLMQGTVETRPIDRRRGAGAARLHGLVG
jgi:hypothetical protein